MFLWFFFSPSLRLAQVHAHGAGHAWMVDQGEVHLVRGSAQPGARGDVLLVYLSLLHAHGIARLALGCGGESKGGLVQWSWLFKA